MPTLTTIAKMIETARKKDFSDNSIGKSLSISAAEIARIGRDVNWFEYFSKLEAVNE